MKNPAPFRGIVLAWAIAGCLDITSAFVIYILRGLGIVRGLQGIAVGLLGRDLSYHGGLSTALLGLMLHFLIMFIVTIVFYLASQRLPILSQRPFPSGILYGVLVYLVMYWTAIPLSRIGPRPHSISNDLTAIIIHICLIGLPIALILSRFSRATSEQRND